MTAPRLFRIDYAVAAIEIVDKDAPTLPTPGHAPARLTAEGYLLADALLARDGLLEYSDGSDTWYEYRPRSELEAAVASWACAPITDKHPARMVDAKTWAKVARGVHVSVPTIVDMQGIAYAQAKILITDADVIARVQKLADQGKPAQLSIGFTSVIIERAGEYAGTPFKYVQTEIVGNHTAIVDEGRAGPICRVLMDGLDVATSGLDEAIAERDRDPCYTHEEMANQPLTPNAKPGSKAPAKTDEVGAPDPMVEVPDPSGQPIMLPSWAAEIIAKCRALEGGAPAPAPAPPMAPAPAPAPMANAMQATPPAPAAPAAPSEEDRKESLSVMIRDRRKLERLAERVGVEASKLDDNDDDLKRAVIAKRMPHAKVDGIKGEALDAFVDTIAAEPAQAKTSAKAPSPWAGATKGDDATKPAPKSDTNDKALAEYLASQGYGS